MVSRMRSRPPPAYRPSSGSARSPAVSLRTAGRLPPRSVAMTLDLGPHHSTEPCTVLSAYPPSRMVDVGTDAQFASQGCAKQQLHCQRDQMQLTRRDGTAQRPKAPKARLQPPVCSTGCIAGGADAVTRHPFASTRALQALLQHACSRRCAARCGGRGSGTGS